MASDKARENRLRRAAWRQGLVLQKSRARDPRDLTYAGFQLCDQRRGGVVAGFGNADRGFALDLDEIEAWLNKEPAGRRGPAA
jgi:hypothetical protein